MNKSLLAGTEKKADGQGASSPADSQVVGAAWSVTES